MASNKAVASGKRFLDEDGGSKDGEKRTDQELHRRWIQKNLVTD